MLLVKLHIASSEYCTVYIPSLLTNSHTPMAKKARAPPPAPTAPAKPSQAVFPALAPKEGLECNVVLEDQVILIDVRGHSLKMPVCNRSR